MTGAKSKKLDRPMTPDRKRSLNLIYFVDSSRTHSIKLPLKSAYWLLALAIIIVTTSISASYFLVKAHEKIGSQNLHINKQATTIFSYQTRYDMVYEKAYPNSKLFSNQAKSIAEKPQQSITPKKPDLIDSKKEPRTIATVGELPSEPQPNVSIEDVSYTYELSQLKTKFAIRNLISPKKSAGYVFGIARFKTSEGKIKVIKSPPSIRTDAKGNPNKFTGAYRFSIRNFKSKSFVFNKPDKLDGQFIEFKIFLSDGKTVLKTFSRKVRKPKQLQTKKVHPNPSDSNPVPMGKNKSPVVSDSNIKKETITPTGIQKLLDEKMPKASTDKEKPIISFSTEEKNQ